MCFFCGLTASVKLIAIGYQPDAQDFENFANMYKKVEIIAQQEDTKMILRRKIQEMQNNDSVTPRQEYYLRVIEEMTEFIP